MSYNMYSTFLSFFFPYPIISPMLVTAGSHPLHEYINDIKVNVASVIKKQAVSLAFFFSQRDTINHILIKVTVSHWSPIRCLTLCVCVSFFYTHTLTHTLFYTHTRTQSCSCFLVFFAQDLWVLIFSELFMCVSLCCFLMHTENVKQHKSHHVSFLTAEWNAEISQDCIWLAFLAPVCPLALFVYCLLLLVLLCEAVCEFR